MERRLAQLESELRILKGRRDRWPRYGIGGGDGARRCANVWLVIIMSEAQATDGAFDLNFFTRDEEEVEDSVTISVNYDDEPEDIEDKLDGNPLLMFGDDDPELIVQIRGGASPVSMSGFVVLNKRTRAPFVTSMSWSNSTLNNGTPYIIPFVVSE